MPVCDRCDATPWRNEKMAVSAELLEILACPKCKGGVVINETEDGLICENCRLVYEIREDIPIMLVDEAVELK